MVPACLTQGLYTLPWGSYPLSFVRLSLARFGGGDGGAGARDGCFLGSFSGFVVTAPSVGGVGGDGVVDV